MGGHVVGKRLKMKVKKTIIPILSVALFLTIGLSLTIGKYPLCLADICGYLFFKLTGTGNMDTRHCELVSNLLLNIRLPRILGPL